MSQQDVALDLPSAGQAFRQLTLYHWVVQAVHRHTVGNSALYATKRRLIHQCKLQGSLAVCRAKDSMTRQPMHDSCWQHLAGVAQSCIKHVPGM